MKCLIKSVDEWIIFLNNLQSLRDIYGSKIIFDALRDLKLLENKLLPKEGKSYAVFSLMQYFGVYSVEDAMLILEKLKNVYNLNVIINKINLCREKYGISHIAFILSSEPLKTICEFINEDNYQLVYTSRDVSYRSILNNNGIIKEIYGNKEFIVDTKNELILYTDEFLFFPLDIDIVQDVSKKKIKLISEVINLISDKNYYLIVDNPKNIPHFDNSLIDNADIKVVKKDNIFVVIIKPEIYNELINYNFYLLKNNENVQKLQFKF